MGVACLLSAVALHVRPLFFFFLFSSCIALWSWLFAECWKCASWNISNVRDNTHFGVEVIASRFLIVRFAHPLLFSFVYDFLRHFQKCPPSHIQQRPCVKPCALYPLSVCIAHPIWIFLRSFSAWCWHAWLDFEKRLIEPCQPLSSWRAFV